MGVSFMDISKKINDIVKKVQTDKSFSAKFKSDPVKAIESVLGVNLPDDQVKALLAGVNTKLAAGKAGGIAGAFKKLFRK